ncbi:uncharacterized protein LKV04_021949 [Tautogolabrus adspersus]
MNTRRRIYAKRKLSAENWPSSFTLLAIMDDHSSTQSFHNHNHHHQTQLPSFHLALPNLQNTEVGYLSSRHALDPLRQYGGREDESKTSFTASNAYTNERRGSNGDDRGLLNASGGSLDVNSGGHFDGQNVRGGKFGDTLFGVCKKEEIWEDGESCESAADHFNSEGGCYNHTNNFFYTSNCGSEVNKVNYNNCVDASYEAKRETVHNSEANASHSFRQKTSYIKSESGICSDDRVNYCRTDSRVSDNYLGREEDFGSSCGSGEDQQQLAEVEGAWPSVSPFSQTEEGRWRGTEATSSGCPSHRSPIGIISGMHTQKLDSFSEAFLSQRRIRFPKIPIGDSSQQIWGFGERGDEKHSFAFDSDSYLPPSSSSSPAHPTLPSFPSPPTSSHLMSSVLSPPPTPLPPSSQSPSKMDSPIASGGYGHSLPQGGEPVGALQFFASHLQCFPSVHTAGKIWNFPLPSHCFPQSSGDNSNMTSPHGRNYGNITVSHNIPPYPESSLLTSSTDQPSFHPIRALRPPNTPSLHSSPHLSSRSSHLSSQHYEAAEKTTHHMMTQQVKNGLILDQSQKQASKAYSGTPFPSILHSTRDQRRGHYTPRPLLNPERRGKGLYSCLSSLHHREEEAAVEEEDECGVFPSVNVGRDFQAELPPCFVDREGSEVWSAEEESLREQLLWKPWGMLEASTDTQDQVEKLLSMCSSSCLPGGGSNIELALHCLHYCQGDIKATMDMLLFSQPLPTGDYHYSGSDLWLDSEKNRFSAALQTYGKDFSLIQKLVRTKTTCQCVEFYYLSKKLLDKQKKLKAEASRDGELEQQKSATPICRPVDRQNVLQEAVPVPSLASFFPCKLCGKMFYKIKSRNAHMKIHRQPQEDWTDRRLQQQILTQRLILSSPNNFVPTAGSALLQPQPPCLTVASSGPTGTSNNINKADNVLNYISNRNASVSDQSTVVTYSNISDANSHVINNIHGGDSNQEESTSVLPFHQSWGSFGHGTSQAPFYYNTEGKEDVGDGTVEGKEGMNWQ